MDHRAIPSEEISSLYYEQLCTMQMTAGGWRSLCDPQSVTVVRRTRRLRIIPRIIIGTICRNTRPGGISITAFRLLWMDHRGLVRFKNDALRSMHFIAIVSNDLFVSAYFNVFFIDVSNKTNLYLS